MLYFTFIVLGFIFVHQHLRVHALLYMNRIEIERLCERLKEDDSGIIGITLSLSLIFGLYSCCGVFPLEMDLLSLPLEIDFISRLVFIVLKVTISGLTPLHFCLFQSAKYGNGSGNLLASLSNHLRSFLVLCRNA